MVNMKFYKNKKVLVTGHTGFKGSWLCRILLLAGAKVYGYALKPATNPNLYSLLNLDKDVKSVYGDIRDYNTLKSFIDEIQPEIVFHL